MVTVRAADMGESLGQVPAQEIVPNHMAYHLAVKAVAFCETITIGRLEVIKALRQQFIENLVNCPGLPDSLKCDKRYWYLF